MDGERRVELFQPVQLGAKAEQSLVINQAFFDESLGSTITGKSLDPGLRRDDGTFVSNDAPAAAG